MVWKNGLQSIVLLLFLWWKLVEILHYWGPCTKLFIEGRMKKKKKKKSEEEIEKEKKNKKEKEKKKNEKVMQLLEGNSCEPWLQRPLA